MSQSTAALVAHLTALQDRIAALERAQRTPQLPTSALGPGQYIGGVDENGDLIARIGFQPDGGFTLRPEPGSGEAPPTPSPPLLTPSTGGLRVVWDGRLVDETDEDVVRPSDLAHVAVEISTGSEWSRVGSITEAGDGGMLPVVPLPYVAHQVRLVAVTTSAVEGPPSATASATPLQVTGPDLAAGSILAGHISAGAVEADKLAAILVLATRVVAGDPNGARVELNGNGFRAYSSAGVLTVAIDAATGNAVYTGTITGSEIVGSSLLVGDSGGDHIWVGEDEDYLIHVVRARGGGAQVAMAATEHAAEMRLTPPPNGGEEFFDGFQYAYVATGSGFAYPAVAYSSPASTSVFPRAATSELQLEGGSSTVDASRIRHRADVHHFSMGSPTSYINGVIEVDSTLSIRSSRHAYVRSEMAAQPTAASELGGAWNAFTSGQWPALSFRTPHSGRVRITIMIAATNPNSNASSIATSFGLTGGSTVSPGLARSAFVRSAGTEAQSSQQSCAAVYLTLAANTNYVLTPHWRTSGATAWNTGSNPATQSYDLALDNSITVEPLL